MSELDKLYQMVLTGEISQQQYEKGVTTYLNILEVERSRYGYQ